MDDSRQQRDDDGREGGMNARPLDDTIAGTGPGIADDGLSPGQASAPEFDTAEIARVAQRLGVSGETLAALRAEESK